MDRISFTGSSNHSARGPKDQVLCRKRTWLKTVSLLGFGGMIVTVLCLFSGCGSDSKPGAVSPKKEKTAANVKKSPGALPLENLGGLSRGGSAKIAPDAAGKMEISPGTGVTIEQVEKTGEAAVKRSESPNYEIVPGMTRQQLEAKIASAQQSGQEKLESPNYEVLPGMTKQQLDAKILAAQQSAQKNRESASDEIIPGISRAELNNKVEAARKQSESQRQEVVPGVTKEELNDKIEEARRKSESQR